MNHASIIKQNIYLKDRMTETQEKRERKNFHQLVHSPQMAKTARTRLWGSHGLRLPSNILVDDRVPNT